MILMQYKIVTHNFLGREKQNKTKKHKYNEQA